MPIGYVSALQTAFGISSPRADRSVAASPGRPLSRPIVPPTKVNVEGKRLLSLPAKTIQIPRPRGEPPSFSLVSMLDRYYANIDDSIERIVNFKHGGPRRRGVFHPSELCKPEVCHRALAYEMYAAPKHKGTDAKMRRIFDNGHYLHARLQSDLWHALKGQDGQFQRELKLPPNELYMTGTADGVIILRGWPYLVEIKSMNRDDFLALSRDPWPEHKQQLNIYMGLCGIKAGWVLIENKNNQDLTEFFVRFDAEAFEATRGMAADILQQIRARELPPKVSEDEGCTGKWCGFYSICKLRNGPKWEPSMYEGSL